MKLVEKLRERSFPPCGGRIGWGVASWFALCLSSDHLIVMSNSFTNQTLAQLELWNNGDKYENKVYTLPKHLDEKVARLHLAKIGVELEVLDPDQAEYIGVTVDGPFKPEYYRY